MPRSYLYLVSSLPPLGEPGSPAPLAPGALLERLDGPARSCAETVFLADDLLQRESHMAGGRAPRDLAVLTAAQARSEAPLPEALAPAGPAATEPLAASDRVWTAFFTHAAALAERWSSAALAGWVRHEVGLRNALAAERSRVLALDPAGFLVTPELGLPAEHFAGDVRAWSAAGDPLEAERVLDTARWRSIGQHDAWFRFTLDELATYALRLALLGRWQRLAGAAGSAG